MLVTRDRRCLALASRAGALRSGTGCAGAGARHDQAPAPVLVFETEKGTFEIETYPSQAPKTVEHIVGLVNKRFYNGLRVHRVVPQLRRSARRSADARHDEEGDVGHGRQRHLDRRRRVLQDAQARARHGLDGACRRSAKADSQFFIVIGPASHLDGQHQILGKVIDAAWMWSASSPSDDRIIRATVKGAK